MDTCRAGRSGSAQGTKTTAKSERGRGRDGGTGSGRLSTTNLSPPSYARCLHIIRIPHLPPHHADLLYDTQLAAGLPCARWTKQTGSRGGGKAEVHDKPERVIFFFSAAFGE